MNRNKKVMIISSIVCLIPIVIGLIFYNQMPDQVAIHWGFDGNPDGYASKITAVVLLPAILFGVNLLLPQLLKMDPKYENISEKSKNLIMWIMPFLSIMLSALTITSALGNKINVTLFAPLACGILFTIIGNYLPKMSQSYTVGIKVPWTLNDEENWDKTHRLAGRLWVICGLLMIVSGFIPNGFIITLVLFVIMLTVPITYSYLEYQKKNK